MITFSDTYAYQSRLKSRDPLQKLFFAALILAVCLWANHGLVSVAVIVIMGGVTVIHGGTPLRFFIKLLLVPFSFLLIGVATIAIQWVSNPEGLWMALPVAGAWIGATPAGLNEALRLFLKALGAVSCLYFLSLSTPISDLLAALRRLRLPKLLVEMMGLIYRFIFVLLETAETIYHAQNCRLGYANLATGYRSLGTLISMLFIRSYRRSDELYTALEARGYEGELNVLEDTYQNHWSGYALALAAALMLVMAALILKRS
jgi:cobalt/nickel transport system permease protein